MARDPNPADRESTPPAAEGSDHADTASGSFDRALDLVRFLRAHCPWDAKQTPESLAPHLLEEAHEVVDAIHAGDGAELEKELGDLLLNLAFQVVVAEEVGRFDADGVTRRIEEKMRRRHPHLYGDGPRADWEAIKAAERAESGDDPEAGVLSGVPSSLDALSRAYRIQDRVAGVGFDWEDWRGALEKVVEEAGEVREELERAEGAEQEVRSGHGGAPGASVDSAPREGGGSAGPATSLHAALEEELGDLLFAVVNLVRLSGSHPVRALDRANRKFTSRFEELERLAAERDVEFGTATLAELDLLWDEVKRRRRERDGDGPSAPETDPRSGSEASEPQ